MKKIFVLYHRNCMDGSGARFAAWLKFRESATYIDVQYREPLPEIDDGSEVYILDFSYSREILEELNKRVAKLVVLDHHKTAMKDLEGLPYATFNMNKSGAMLAWQYFHPEKSVPAIISLVQDRDLWKFSWPDSKRFHAGMKIRRENTRDWLKASEHSVEGCLFLDLIKTEGDTVLRYEEAEIQNLLKRVKFVRFLHTRIGIVNSSVLKDELGQAIYGDKSNRVQGAIIYTIEPETRRALLSFRGPKDVDWSWVARHLGGGGHATSCNATVDLRTLNRILQGKFLELPSKNKFAVWLQNVLEAVRGE